MLKKLESPFLRGEKFCQFKKKSDFCTHFFAKKVLVNNVNKQ